MPVTVVVSDCRAAVGFVRSNLVQNGSFEVDTSDWLGHTIHETTARVTTDYHSGSACISVSSDGTNTMPILDQLSKTPIGNQIDFFLSFWAKGGTASQIQGNVILYDSGNNQLVSSGFQVQTILPIGWTYSAHSFFALNGINSTPVASFSLQFQFMVANGSVVPPAGILGYLDDIQVEYGNFAVGMPRPFLPTTAGQLSAHQIVTGFPLTISKAGAQRLSMSPAGSV